MAPWLAIWIARFAAGERLEKTGRRDCRGWFGFFFLLPVGVALSLYFGRGYLDRANAIGVWLVLFVFGLVFLAFSAFWARFVPAAVSLSLGVVTWIVAFWMAWQGKLGF